MLGKTWKYPLLYACLAGGLVPLAIRSEPAQRAASAAALFRDDARLERPVSGEYRHRPLDEVLEAIGRQAGVTLRPEGDAADLRITAALTSVPARQVLLRAAELLHLTWRSEGDGAGRAYILFASAEDRVVVQAEKRRYRAQLVADIRRLGVAISAPERLGHTVLDEAARRHAGVGPIRAAAGLVSGLPDAELENLIASEDGVVLPVSGLSPGQRRSLADLGTALGRSLGPAANGPAAGLLHLSISNRMIRVSGYSGGRPGGGISFGPYSLTAGEKLQIHREFSTRQYAVPQAGPLELPRSGAIWEDALLEFAARNHVSVLTDALDPPARAETGEQEWITSAAAGQGPERMLHALCAPYDYTWNAAAPLLLFRRADNAAARDGQIPIALERHWRAIQEGAGTYSLDDLAGMAALNIRRRTLLRDYAGRDAWGMASSRRTRPGLLLYVSLRDDQRRETAAEKGLAITGLNLSQKQAFATVARSVRPDATGLSQSPVRLHSREAPKERRATISVGFRGGEVRAVELRTAAERVPEQR